MLLITCLLVAAASELTLFLLLVQDHDVCSAMSEISVLEHNASPAALGKTELPVAEADTFMFRPAWLNKVSAGTPYALLLLLLWGVLF